MIIIIIMLIVTIINDYYYPGLLLRAPRQGVGHARGLGITPSLPTKSSGFRGFDSSRLLILKGGNSHVRIIS